MITRCLNTSVVAALVLLSACRRDKPPAQDTAVVKIVVPPPPDPFIVAGGRRLTFTMDSVPAEAMLALRARYPEFVPYKPGDYPASARSIYRATPDDGMSVVRASLRGPGTEAYAVAGRRGESQDVIGVVREANGWVARTVSSSSAPPFGPWITVARRRREHPNGLWDGVAVKVLDANAAFEDVYYWDTKERQFSLGRGR